MLRFIWVPESNPSIHPNLFSWALLAQELWYSTIVEAKLEYNDSAPQECSQFSWTVTWHDWSAVSKDEKTMETRTLLVRALLSMCLMRVVAFAHYQPQVEFNWLSQFKTEAVYYIYVFLGLTQKASLHCDAVQALLKEHTVFVVILQGRLHFSNFCMDQRRVIRIVRFSWFEQHFKKLNLLLQCSMRVRFSTQIT